MGAGFTPGPWKVDYSPVGRRPYGISTAEIRGGRNITNWNSFAKPASTETEANARLIASAPEIYEALDELCASVEREEELNGSISGALMSDVREARAVIAKATGDQS